MPKHNYPKKRKKAKPHFKFRGVEQNYDTAAQMLINGESLRRVSELSGLARGTIARIRKLVAGRIKPCGCGKPSGHRGWCSYLYQFSEKRQEVVKKFSK